MLGELDGVSKEVVQNLTQSAGIAAQVGGDVGFKQGQQFNPIGVSLLGEQPHGSFDNLAQVEV